MIFRPTALAGLLVVEPELEPDERGFFARLHCPVEFAAAGIDFRPVQTSLSHNDRRHTLRGLHFQAPPRAEAKLVRAVRGRVFDVAVDLRPQSPTCHGWVGIELDAARGAALFIPQGFAHGFLTLEPDTDLLYQISPGYLPGHDRGLRWDDPAIGICWPATPAVISPRDADYPDLGP